MFRQRHIISFISLTLILAGLAVSLFYGFPGDRAVSVNARTSTRQPADGKTKQQANEEYGKLPLSFVANEGQVDSQVKFYARGKGYGLFLTPTEAVLALHQFSGRKPAAEGAALGKEDGATKAVFQPAGQTSVLRMKLKDANPRPEVKGLDELAGKVNHFTGTSSEEWQTDIATYAKVQYEEVYPGVDMVYYGNQGQLEYDFIVAPGADANVIGLEFAGSKGIKVDENGELILNVAGREVRQLKPFAYQEVEGKRQEVASRYVIGKNGQVTFDLGRYDTAKPLVIDPVLVYSTYLGGTSGDTAYGIAVDASGHTYITGATYSKNFPITAGAFQTRNVGVITTVTLTDVFITKLNSAGNAAIYSTYLGGTEAVENPNDYSYGPIHGNDEAHGIVVDSAGNVFVAGMTASTRDFPVTQGAYRTTFERTGATSAEDVFVAKLNAAGNGLIYSTRVGGTGSDQAHAIGIDNDGNAYVTGITRSPDFPATLGAFSQNQSDAFVIKLNSTGTALGYSVLLGSGMGRAIAVDASGNAYVAGRSYTATFSVTPGAFQTVAPGGAAEGYINGFVTKINPAGDALVYSTFLGGKRNDEINGIAIDASGHAYVGGHTDAFGFPITPGAYKPTGNIANGTLGEGPFVTKLNPAGTSLVYSTYVSGAVIRALAVNTSGEVYVTGETGADLITTSDAFQQVLGGVRDAFVAKLNASGSSLLYSTYLGGIEHDCGNAIALDSAGAIYVAGITLSTNFPITPDTFQTTPSGNRFDMGSFVTKIGEAPTGQTYRLSGRLTDSNGNGIARARVLLGGSPGGTQFTDTNGNYAFGSLTPGGSYSVTPSSPYYDFNPQSRSFDNLSADQTADFTATTRRYGISGIVKDRTGKPLEGVTMTLTGAQSAVTQTDANGNYAFSDLSAVGNYTLTPSKPGYAFNPSRQVLSNLDGHQTVNFTGRLFYSVKGQVLDSAGKALPGIKITITDGIGFAEATTNSTGNYAFNGLSAGDNYTLTPVNADYTFAPPSQSINNLSADQTANFTATYRFGSINGSVTDADGKGMNFAKITLTGTQTVTTTADFNGNYRFSRLLKGGNYTVSVSAVGYAFTPAPTTVNVTGDHTVNFTGVLKKLQSFTSGNILVTPSITFGGRYLMEYTPNGTLVQDVIIPSLTNITGNAAYLGDIVLDKNSEVKIYNGPSSVSYLSSYSFRQAEWRHQTYPNWSPWSLYNLNEGIATFGDYVYVTDKITNDFGQPTQTAGIIRININDYSSERYLSNLTFAHITLGQDGLLYGLLGGTSGSELNAYNPTTMQLVKTVRLTDANNSPLNVHRIAVNQAGEIFATGFSLHHFDNGGKMVKSVQVSGNLTDVEISNNGQIAVGTHSSVTLLDGSLNIINTFAVPLGAGHLAFTNTVAQPPLRLALDESGPAPAQAAALDSILLMRDPFPVVNATNLLNPGPDKNTRVILFVANLKLAQGEASSSVIVNLVDANNQNYEIAAEDVSIIPGLGFAQVRFRLPDTLAPGTSTIKVKAQGRESNSATIRIKS